MEKKIEVKLTGEEIINEKFRSYQKYLYNKTVYEPNNLNRVQYDYYMDNDLVKSLIVNDSSKLAKKILNIENNLGDRTNRIDDIMRYVNPIIEESMDKELVQRLNIEDQLNLNYMKDSKQSTLSIFILSNDNSGNQMHYLIYPAKTDGTLNITPINIAHNNNSVYINDKKHHTVDLNTIQRIFGLSTIMTSTGVYLVINFFKELHLYKIDFDTNFYLTFLFRYTVHDFFIKHFNINPETSHICILFESFDEKTSEIHLINIEGLLIFRKVHSKIFHRLHCYGNQDSILVNTHNNVLYVDKLLDKLQNLKSSDNTEETGNELIYNVFNYNSCKIYGYVTSRYVKFFDYRFPKSGILSTPHHCIVPPESSCFNKNPTINMAWEKLLAFDDTSNLDEMIQDFSTIVNPNDRLFLFSVRKNGNILTIPHARYKDKKDITNNLAYNLIKEINFTNYKDNRFLNLLMHSSDITKGFSSSYKYNDFKINGVDVLRIDNKFVVFSLEEKSLINIQVLAENKDKSLRPISFITDSQDLMTLYTLEHQIIENFTAINHEMIQEDVCDNDGEKLSRVFPKTTNPVKVVDSNTKKQPNDILTANLASQLKSSW